MTIGVPLHKDSLSMTELRRLLLDWSSERKRYVVFLVEGSDDNTGNIGRKSAYQSKLFRMGLPIPPEFTITAAGSREYFETGYISPEFTMRYRKALCELETQADKKFGISTKDTSYFPEKLPLLLNIEADCSLPLSHSVCVVNVGMNDTIVAYLSRTVGSAIPALRLYASFLRSFGHLVFSIADGEYDRIVAAACAHSGVECTAQLETEGWERVVAGYKRLAPVPQDPYEQLQKAIEGVYACWSGHYSEEVRAQAEAGIAVRVQSAVHGGGSQQDSGSGLLRVEEAETGLLVRFLPGGEMEDLRAAAAQGDPAVLDLPGLREWGAAVADSVEDIGQILRWGMSHSAGGKEADFVVEAGVVYVSELRFAEAPDVCTC